MKSSTMGTGGTSALRRRQAESLRTTQVAGTSMEDADHTNARLDAQARAANARFNAESRAGKTKQSQVRTRFPLPPSNARGR